MRKLVWYPALMDRKLSNGLVKDQERDMLARAQVQYKKMMSSADYEIDADRRRAIEQVVKKAESVLV
jgi:hypothetical protein